MFYAVPVHSGKGLRGISRLSHRRFLSFLLFILLPAAASAEVTLYGRVTDELTGKPVPFVTVAAPDSMRKTRSGEDGNYSLLLPQPGKTEIIVTATGLKPVRVKLNIPEKGAQRNFVLSPMTARGARVTIQGDRDVQKISRYTMKSEEIKEMPGAMGDSVSAIASLPGMLRVLPSRTSMGGLVVRGMYPELARYYLDEMPLYNPQHFGGLHAVVSNDYISEIDVLSSAYGANTAGGGGPVIRIHTLDSAKEFSGNSELNILSANFFVKSPVGEGLPHQGIVSHQEDRKSENIGYYAFGGRLSYYQYLVPPIAQILSGRPAELVPQYYDYQGKIGFFLNNQNRLSLLFAGSYDEAYYLQNTFRTELERIRELGDDPLGTGAEAKFDLNFQNVGAEYSYQPNSMVQNKSVLYAAFAQTYQAADLPKSLVLKDAYVDSRPNIYGVKEIVSVSMLRKAIQWKAGLESVVYQYSFDSNNIYPTSYDPQSGAGVVLSEPYFIILKSKKSSNNLSTAGFTSLKLQKWGVMLEPGVRADYLFSTETVAVDPRIKAAVELPTETTISAAYGRYSMFLQTNPYYFRSYPEISGFEDFAKPYVTKQYATGLEQKFPWFLFKAEGFYNTVENYFTPSAHCEGAPSVTPDSEMNCASGTFSYGYHTGELKTYGAEFLLYTGKQSGSSAVFGMLSYTYSRSYYRSGIEGHPLEDWGVSLYDQPHSLNIMLGRVLGSHTFSGKFQISSGLPYNPIVASELDSTYTKPTGYPDRYAPVFDERATARFDTDYNVHLRYSYKKEQSWGQIVWYIEIINSLTFIQDRLGATPASVQDWYFNKPYASGKNPDMIGNPLVFTIPNIGVEMKF